MPDEHYESTYTGAIIDEALGHDHNPADYVVASGTSDGWSYRKWNSGKAECWMSTTVRDIEITATWGAGWYKQLDRVTNYPLAFIETPVVNILVQSTNGFAIGAFGDDYSLTNPGRPYLFCPSRPHAPNQPESFININATINYYVIGNWK